MKLRPCLALISLLALASCGGCPGCSQGPRPSIVIGTPATAANAARVTATVTPNVFAVTKVILEFGRRPTASNAVNVIYTSEPGSYNLSHTFDPPTFPTTDRFDATFRFPTLTAGELVDYQFKVTHRNADGNELFFWSERKTMNGQRVSFVTRTAFDANAAADVDQIYVRDLESGDILRVSTPANGINGGSTTDRGGAAPILSGNGRFVAFVTHTQFDPNAANGVDEIYRRCLPE